MPTATVTKWKKNCKGGERCLWHNHDEFIFSGWTKKRAVSTDIIVLDTSLYC